MRGILVGYGFIAAGHLKYYDKTAGVDIVCVIDATNDRRRAAAERGYEVRENLSEALVEFRPDFVDVCTPPSTHSEYMRTCLDAGVAVLCEKPTFTVDEDDSIISSSIEAGRPFAYPVHNYRYAPAFQRLSSLLATHKPSAVAGQIRTLRTGHAKGDQNWEPDWRRDPYYSLGGILRDHGPHTMYSAELLTGSKMRAVQAWLHNADSFTDTESTANLRIRFENDAEVSVHLSWTAIARESHYEMSFRGGDHISLTNDVLTGRIGGTELDETIPSNFDDASHSEWFGGVWSEFLQAHHDTLLRRTRLAEAARIRDAITAAYDSANNDGVWRSLT